MNHLYIPSILCLLALFVTTSECQSRSKLAFCKEAGEGFHPHPEDCTKFIRCVSYGHGLDGHGSGFYRRFDFDCAPHTVYDPVLLVCNYAGAGGTSKDCMTKTAQRIVSSRLGKTQTPRLMHMPMSMRVAAPAELMAAPKVAEETPSSPPDNFISSRLKPSNDFDKVFPTKLRPELLVESPESKDTTTTPDPDPCTCNANGTLSLDCDLAGKCNCKKNVDGPRCSTCKDGHFNLNSDNKFGCSPCFCFGHTTTCRSAEGFNDVPIRSSFSKGPGAWKAVDESGAHVDLQWVKPLQLVAITPPRAHHRVYFSAPPSYLGEQRRSYGRRLNLTLYIDNERDYIHSNHEPFIILEGSGLRVFMPILGTEFNPYPEDSPQIYSFKLDPETPGRGWQPRLSKNEFLKLLSNVTAIKIRAYFPPEGGTTYLDNVFLESARMRPDGPPDFSVEECECPEGYAGRSCEECADGFMRASCGGDSFEKCMRCTDKESCGC